MNRCLCTKGSIRESSLIQQMGIAVWSTRGGAGINDEWELLCNVTVYR